MTKQRTETKMELLANCLEKRGLKSTKQRHYIADTFFRSNTHISLEELHKKVKRKSPRAGYATVYRTMKLLTECGLAIERQFGDGQTRFENVPEDGHHDHLICLKCSEIVEFQNETIEQLQDKTATELGFNVVRHKLELYGYCKNCK
ncbi:MAG: transcriptional repressor [Deltaproteobacteria bacterium]|nr:transcriptional repressor [Deltaproteobacteria bacterium]